MSYTRSTGYAPRPGLRSSPPRAVVELTTALCEWLLCGCPCHDDPDLKAQHEHRCPRCRQPRATPVPVGFQKRRHRVPPTPIAPRARPARPRPPTPDAGTTQILELDLLEQPPNCGSPPGLRRAARARPAARRPPLRHEHPPAAAATRPRCAPNCRPDPGARQRSTRVRPRPARSTPPELAALAPAPRQGLRRRPARPTQADQLITRTRPPAPAGRPPLDAQLLAPRPPGWPEHLSPSPGPQAAPAVPGSGWGPDRRWHQRSPRRRPAPARSTAGWNARSAGPGQVPNRFTGWAHWLSTATRISSTLVNATTLTASLQVPAALSDVAKSRTGTAATGKSSCPPHGWTARRVRGRRPPASGMRSGRPYRKPSQNGCGAEAPPGSTVLLLSRYEERTDWQDARQREGQLGKRP